jgi:hypothetical protein
MERASIMIDRRFVLVDKSAESKNITIVRIVGKYPHATKSKGLTFVSFFLSVEAAIVTIEHLHLEIL